MPRLYVLSGPDVGRTFDVRDGSKVGRAAGCEVHLRDASVSREHARIERSETGWRIVDAGSRNGLALQGAKVESAELADGLEFRVGEVLLRFRSDVRAKPEATAAARAPDVHEELVLEEDPAPGVAETVTARGLAAPPPPPPPTSRPTIATPRGRGILQYNRVPDRSGFFGSDLGQHAAWVRVGAGILALAVFAAIFWLAFRGTAMLKGRASGGDPAEDVRDG